MCTTCGCGSDEVTIDHVHHHHHEHETRTIAIEQDVLAKNQLFAERNRGWFAGREVAAINLMGTPGAGKTTLLERTIRESGGVPIAVLEGDQATANDAERIRDAGAPVVQINTGTGCHLDAHMVAHGIDRLAPPRGSLLVIENVGNLVCPALFDLGEQARVVLVSVTEGDDKPLKYPHMFRAADLILLNKIDLLPHVRFDVARFLANVDRDVPVLRVSAETGEGMADWYTWLGQADFLRGDPGNESYARCARLE